MPALLRWQLPDFLGPVKYIPTSHSDLTISYMYIHIYTHTHTYVQTPQRTPDFWKFPSGVPFRSVSSSNTRSTQAEPHKTSALPLAIKPNAQGSWPKLRFSKLAKLVSGPVVPDSKAPHYMTAKPLLNIGIVALADLVHTNLLCLSRLSSCFPQLTH